MPNSNNSSRTIYIPVDGDSDCFGAAYYHALLAYPKDTEQRKLKELVKALTGYLAKEYISTGGKRVDIPPRYRKLRRRDIYQTIDQGLYRIQAWRLTAATVAYKIIGHNPEVWRHLSLPPESHQVWRDLPAGARHRLRTPMSVNEAAAEISALIGAEQKEMQHLRKENIGVGPEISNVLSRIWSSTKPVLHLAIAYPTTPGEITDPLHLIKNPSSWLPQAVRHAEVLRSVLGHFIPSFDPSKAVRLLPSKK